MEPRIRSLKLFKSVLSLDYCDDPDIIVVLCHVKK